MPTIDVDSLKAGAATIMTNAATLQKSSEALSKALPELKKQLKSIEDAEGVLAQAGQLSTLTGSVDQLNAGMQGLNSAIGTLHSNLATLNNATSAQFPTAIQGITALNKGFAQLSGYNDSLVGGANKLRSNSPTLVAEYFKEWNQSAGKRTEHTGKPDVFRICNTCSQQRCT